MACTVFSAGVAVQALPNSNILKTVNNLSWGFTAVSKLESEVLEPSLSRRRVSEENQIHRPTCSTPRQKRKIILGVYI